MQLFPYQIEGARFLAERGRALLADEMGLGKSAQAIAAAAALQALNVVVVCPASLVENWKREFKKWASIRSDWGYALRVQSYDSIARHGLLDHRTFALEEMEIDVLILDESHFLKNHKAKRTKAIFGEKCDGAGGLVSRAKHVFLLTGTPTPNHPAELWPMLRAVLPDAISPRAFQGIGKPAGMRLKPLTYWQFVQKYCRTRDNGFGVQIVGGKNLDKLKEAIAPYVLRRKKEEVLTELPPIRFDELPLSGAGFGVTEELRLEIVRIRDAIEKDGVAGLREIAPHVAQLRRVTGLAKVPAAVEWIKEWRESGGGKLVIFAQHRDVIDTLARSLAGHVIHDIRADDQVTGDGVEDVSLAVVHGATTDRQRQVDRFQNDNRCRLFIGQIQAAGTGITLTAASDLLFVESSWVPAENEQAAMRIHRIGQRNACLVRFATLAGSIDEQIQRAVMRKTADIAKLFN